MEIPRLVSMSCKVGGDSGCTLAERIRGVEVPAAEPLLAELAGEVGAEAIRYWTGRSGVGGRLAAVCTATVI